MVVLWCMLTTACLAPSALAQGGWEMAYGDPDESESGKLRVTPVTMGCDQMPNYTQTDGYIAVGTDLDNGDVYVVRTDNAGARIWEKTYDITGNGDNDQGAAIAELADGSGFAITGRVYYTSGQASDAFILKIDCEGGVVWSNTYGAVQWQEWGNDIIEAQTGAAASGTNPGDLVVCGLSTANLNGTVSGLIFRVTSGGAMIWSRVYQPGVLTGGPSDVKDDELFALTELSRFGATTTGDIIAVGITIPPGGPSVGWSVRVNGNNGTIGFAPQGLGVYANTSVLHAVEELRNPNERDAFGRPNVLMGGEVVTAANGAGSYLVKLTGGDPCLVAGQAHIRPTGPNNPTLPITTLREIRFPTGTYTGSANQWEVAASAYRRDALGNEQAVLMTINSGTLTVAGIANQFGGTGQDRAWSVFPVDATGGRNFGFILCGETNTDWEGLGDPYDLYLIKTDGFGATGCEGSLGYLEFTPTGSSCPGVSTGSTMPDNSEASLDKDEDAPYQVCSTAAARPAISNPATIASYAVPGGGTFTLPLENERPAGQLHLYDVTGTLVKRIGGEGPKWSVTIDGTRLSPGVYFLGDRQGKQIARIQVLY